MVKNVLFVAAIAVFLFISKTAFCGAPIDDSADFQIMGQKKQYKQSDKQNEIMEGLSLLQEKAEKLQERLTRMKGKKNSSSPAPQSIPGNTSSSGEQNVRRVVEDILLERDQEKELSAMFSEGGLENMLFHGYVDLEWVSVEFDRAQGGSRGHNFFDNHHFNLWFGYVLADNLVAKGEIEIEHGGDEFKLEFGEIEWKPFSNDHLEILLGKILVPLGIENPVHSSVWNKLISRPLPSRSIIPGTYSDIGFEVRGWIPSTANPQFRYHIYVVNGIGDDDGDNIYEQKSLKRSRDNNGNKSIGAQIAIFPLDGVEIGGSSYYGKWDNNDNNGFYILGPHFIYNKDPIEIRVEYVLQHIEMANGPGSPNAYLSGFYVQGAYQIPDFGRNSYASKWEAVARFDGVDNEDGVASLKQGDIPLGKSSNRIAMGLIFRPQDWLQFKMEYLYRNNKNGKNDNGLAFQSAANW